MGAGRTVETAAGLAAHKADHKPQAWEAYAVDEHGQWVHLLSKRAEHRDNEEKKAKDLHDAQNYLDMMQARLNAQKLS